MKYVRVVYDSVQEVFTPINDLQIENYFHPDVVAQFEQATDEVEVGWKKHADGTFSAPLPSEIPVASV